MFQQINLYQPIFREEQKIFSATTIAIGLGVIAAGLAAIAGIGWWRVAGLDHALQAVRTQDAAHRRLEGRVSSMLEQGESRASIEARLRVLAIDLQRHQQALHYLHSDALGGREGFADRLEALAREHLEGLWLKGAILTSESGRITLSGGAQNAELVPIYLGRLANEASLAGAKVDRIEIRQPKNAPRGEIEFTVASGSAPASPGAAAALAANAAGPP